MSDTFSFGVMMWAIAEGCTPWPKLTARDAARQHCKGQRLPAPTGRMADAELACIMQDCWAQDPVERPRMAYVCEKLKVRAAQLWDRWASEASGVAGEERDRAESKAGTLSAAGGSSGSQHEKDYGEYDEAPTSDNYDRAPAGTGDYDEAPGSDEYDAAEEASLAETEDYDEAPASDM